MRAPRSVAEVLPAPFETMSIADVTDMLDGLGDERETLFVELKRELSSAALSKSCAAFANTYGGLLVGGVDDDGKLAGMEAPGGEVSMWVKDTLRSTVLPLPPFRARWVPLGTRDSKGLLLVLVEESSTTPHLLLSRGAIYVRAPGSSDPVPIRDQALLLELTRRGTASRDRAARRSTEVAGHTFANPTLLRVGIAPTGFTTDPVRELYEGRHSLDTIEGLVLPLTALRQDSYETASAETHWALEALTYAVHRDPPPRSFGEPSFHDGARIGSDCSIGLSRALVPSYRDQSGVAEPRGPRSVDLRYDLLPWLTKAVKHGLDCASDLGGHGDARIHLELGVQGRHVFYADQKATLANADIALDYWAPVETNDGLIERLIDEVRSDVFRALGLSPGVLAASA